MKNKKTLFGILALVLTSTIWGFAFSAQRTGMEYLSPQVFNAMRSFLGGLVLIPVIFLLDRLAKHPVSLWGCAQTPAARKTLLIGGVICGLVLGIAGLTQQVGIKYSTAGKSGFLTALYIVIVPIIGMFFGQRSTWLLWTAVLAALGGSWLLCVTPGGFSMGFGDLWLIGCAVLFSIHILVISCFAPKTDCVRMSCIQFFTAGVVSVIVAVVMGDSWNWKTIVPALGVILYCGICSSGIAYTLQIIGQKYVHPTAASLIMSLESVFAVIGGGFFLGERLSGREFSGCAVIFAAVILAQIPLPKKKGIK